MSEQEINFQTAMTSGETGSRSVGAQLSAAREAHGWTVEQVANQLNLATRQIQAMERDDYAALPGISIARGFIRAYAKLLKIDVTPLLAAIPGEVEKTGGGVLAREALSTPFADTRLPSMADRPVISAKWYALLVVLVLVLAGLWAQRQGMLRSVTEPIGAMLVKLRSHSSPSAPISPTTTTQEQPTAPVTDQAKTQEPAVPESSQVAPPAESESANTAPSSDAQVPAPEASAVSASPQSQVQPLVLNVHADSWVEIRHTDNTIVFSGVLGAGKTQSWELDGPVSLVIGNAAGVDATYRGKPLELKANTSSNVARLNLK